MTAYWADAGSGLAEIAAQQQQIHRLLHVCSAEPVLGDPHAVDDDNGACSHVDGRHTLQLVARKPAYPQYVFPIGLAEIVRERLEAVCMLRDEIEIEHWFLAVAKCLVMRLQHQLHDPLESRDIAANADLAILAGDPRLAKRRRAKAAREQLVHERRLVRGAPRGVELGLIRVV